MDRDGHNRFPSLLVQAGRRTIEIADVHGLRRRRIHRDCNGSGVGSRPAIVDRTRHEEITAGRDVIPRRLERARDVSRHQ